MKLFKKFLSIALSFGMIFSSALPLRVFAGGDDETSVIGTSEIPTNLEECCLVLDKILNQEEKDKIKQSPVNARNSYLRKLSLKPLGVMMRRDWLYSYKDNSSALFTLLLEHGADFDGSMELDEIMINMILENYRHYLLTGESVESIEDLAIDYWFNLWRSFGMDIKREQYEEMMENWKKAKESRRGTAPNKTDKE